MFFNKYKKKIESLEKDLAFWQKSCDELQKTIDDLREKNNTLKNSNTTLNNQVIEINRRSQENEIMKKYDMEFKMFQEKLNNCQQQQFLFNQMLLSLPYYSIYCPRSY